MLSAAPQNLHTSTQHNWKLFSASRTDGATWSMGHANAKQQSPSWYANCYLSSQKNSLNFREPQVHYLVQNSPPSAHILSQIIPVHFLTHPFFKTCSSILLPSILQSAKWSVQVFQPKFCMYFSLSPCMLRVSPSHFISAGWRVQTVILILI